MIPRTLLSALLFTTLALPACGPQPPEPPPTPATTKEEAAEVILFALKHRDMPALASWVHPEKGVRFTPFTTVDLLTDVVLTPRQVAQAEKDPATYTWGTEAGSGEPIVLTMEEYMDRYVYRHDFVEAPVVRWNQPSTYGSAIDNAAQIYPDAEIIEYHFDGFDPQYGGMDWSSLRLVLEQDGGSWKLVGVINDEWTP